MRRLFSFFQGSVGEIPAFLEFQEDVYEFCINMLFF